MAHADPGRRESRATDAQQPTIETLKHRVDTLEYQHEQTVQLQRAAEHREQQLRAYNTILTRLSLSQPIADGQIDTAYHEICGAAAEALNVPRVGLWFFNEDESELHCQAAVDRRSTAPSCAQVLYAAKYPEYFRALRQGRTVPADDAQHDPCTHELKDDYLVPCKVTSMLDAPVRVGGRVIGVICHEHQGSVRRWTMDEQNFAGSMGDLVSLTIQARRRCDAEEAVESQRAYLREIIDISPNLVFVLDCDGRFVFVNNALAELLQSDPEQLLGTIGVEFITDEQQAKRIREMDLDVLERNKQHVVSVEAFQDGEGKKHWYQITKRPIAAPDGQSQQVLGVAVDITERKLYEDRLATLVRELDHRVKNNLFAVMIMAEHSAASASSMQSFLSAFNGRIRAMSVAHEMLAMSNWQGANLRDIVQRLVHPIHPGENERVTIDGPNVLLSPTIAPAVCTMLHELVTNAVNYGSLSSPDGSVDVSWTVADGELHLIWKEHDGPQVHKPSELGFGIELIERVTEHQLRGNASVRFEVDGVRCELKIPLHDRARAGVTA